MNLDEAADLARAVRSFQKALPGWWWTIGYCMVSGDASCGPDRQGPDADLLTIKEFDEGFHFDIAGGTAAAALRAVTSAARKARQRARIVPPLSPTLRNVGE